MSLITSCPACGTMFRVVPDQLRISEGWVRCGHCSEIFDATAHMAPPDAGSSQAEGPPTQPADWPTQPPDWDLGALPRSSRTPLAGPPSTTPTATASAGAEQRIPRWPGPPGRSAGLEDPLAGEPLVRDGDFLEEPLDAPASGAAAPMEAGRTDAAPRHDTAGGSRETRRAHREGPSSESPQESRPAELARASRPADLAPVRPRTAPAAADDADLEQVSFVQQARRKAFWRRPGVRMGLAFTSACLAAVLLLQLAYDERNRLAAAQPQLRPWLQRMCDALRCQIGPPRQIEAIVIESSAFSRLRGDTYRLSFTLRNTGAFEVAAPAMELTLTDTQDQPLVRRVLTSAELGGRATVIGAASDWSSAIGLTVGSTGSGRVAGYRLLAFYP